MAQPPPPTLVVDHNQEETTTTTPEQQQQQQQQPSSEEGHRTHLLALLHQEQDAAYQREDYLGREWQLRLWHNKRALEGEKVHGSGSSSSCHDIVGASRGRSPSSAAATITPDPSSCCRTSVAAAAAAAPPPPKAPSEICARWRDRIVEWKYQIVDTFDLDRELVSISSFYMDKYLSMNYVDEELFQLTAMASIYLTIKIHSLRKVTSRSIASTGNNDTHITARHIEAMEISIMSCLDWRLHPPTSAAFVGNLVPLTIAPLLVGGGGGGGADDHAAVDTVLEFARFLAELSVCAYPFITARPSSVALAAVLCGLECLHRPPVETTALREAFRWKLARDVSPDLDPDCDEVVVCVDLLRRVYALAVPNDLSFSS